MIKPILPFVETMITYACNLSCAGCTNYSDYNMKGSVSWVQGKQWLEQWLQRIDIESFGIIGGEPTLNPDCKQWICGVRDMLPDAQIRFTTNGVNFLNNPDILDTCVDAGNVVFKFTSHEDKPYTKQIIEHVFSAYNWKPITEYGINRWIGPNNSRFQINAPTHFYKTYRGEFGYMQPHNNLPNDAFSMCVQQTCPLLYEGKIYKCSSIALLEKVLGDWKQTDVNCWDKYLKYKPITVDSDIMKIENFIYNFGKSHTICSMCPTAKDRQSMINHKTNVITKKQWLIASSKQKDLAHLQDV